MSNDVRIVIGGFLGLFTAGGVVWDYMQYPLGFHELGYDVYYVEDTRLWPIFQDDAARQVSADTNIQHLANVMRDFGLGERWAYRDEVSGECHGLPLLDLQQICRSADVFLNISCSTYMRDEYLDIPVRMLLDSDPMFTQMQYVKQMAFTAGEAKMQQLLRDHTHHFTFGLNVGGPDCRVPTCGFDWIPTLQPICLQHWPVLDFPGRQDSAYTTVMNWTVADPVAFEDERWGQKDVELQRVMALPRDVPEIPLAIAVAQTTGSPFPSEVAQQYGWQVINPQQAAPDWQAYRRFIQQSRGEFSVAKETYVKARTGWFSCRSACYLASGRPVVTQDTGWSCYLPGDGGLLPFHDRESAIAALREMERDPGFHSQAARQIADEYFDSSKVLSKMLAAAGVG